jgi:hypothetical protein
MSRNVAMPVHQHTASIQGKQKDAAGPVGASLGQQASHIDQIAHSDCRRMLRCFWLLNDQSQLL